MKGFWRYVLEFLLFVIVFTLLAWAALTLGASVWTPHEGG